MTKTEYNIVRRAFSKRTIVARMVLTFVDAECTAMMMQNERQDGEYFAVPAEYEDLRYPSTGVDQSTLPIAWV
jgi:cytochrome c-type biogenesis protein CcmE